MKMKRLLIAFCLCGVVLLGNILSVNAAESEAVSMQEVTVIPRAAICPHCMEGTLFVTGVSYSPWYNGAQVSCSHKGHGVDIFRYQEVTTYLKCNKCQVGGGADSVEGFWECHGF